MKMKMFGEILSWRADSVEVGMRNGEMGVKYVKYGDAGWTPVVRRRRKSARSKKSENVNSKRRSLVMYRKVTGSHEYISFKI